MICYKVSERKDHRFDYTCSDAAGNNIFPVGYCARYRNTFNAELTPEAFKFIDKHHTNGHSTPQEAADCYKEYQLDRHLKLHLENKDKQDKCAVCGNQTSLSASLKSSTWTLCDTHNNREEVSKLFHIDAKDVIWEG